MMEVRIRHDLAILDSGTVTYVLQVVDGHHLIHRYFGPTIREWHEAGNPQYAKTDFTTDAAWTIPNASRDDVPFEYPVFGRGDFRSPAIAVRLSDGTSVIEPQFASWQVVPGKSALPGLPATFGSSEECQTLETTLVDEASGLVVKLYHTVFAGLSVVAQHQILENRGDSTIILEKADSATLNLTAGMWDVLSLYGTHAKEANVDRVPLGHGNMCVQSTRGSSGPQHTPFLALADANASETQGQVYAMQLIYSGNFAATAQRSAYGEVRAQIGIHPQSLHWPLAAGENFCSPEAIVVFSDTGLNGMSHAFHDLYSRHLMPQRFADKPAPILLNTWEAMYYDVSLEKLQTQAHLAARAGIELMVLDDGWFRVGNSSRAPIGDWEWNEDKLPGGLHAAATIVHANGLQFGLWFEPEAASRRSKLLEEHPDWILRVAEHDPVEGRHEYLLDLTRSDVCDHIVKMLSRYLETGWIDYVKWDMNRPMTDAASARLPADAQGSVPHRYVLGLYSILERITNQFPEVRIETCSSGGCRFDPGMLYYAPQNWASDNTDAIDRLTIQRGFSLTYPPRSIGAHVSAVPNHRSGRVSTLEARFEVARLFNAGYEMDFAQLPPEEFTELCNQVEVLKAERDWTADATFWRHEVPSDVYTMWSVVARDGSQVLAQVIAHRWDPLQSRYKFKLLGLDTEADYRNTMTGTVQGGDELMLAGFSVPLARADMQVHVLHFERLDWAKGRKDGTL